MIFVVSGKHSNSLLGRNAACKMGLIQRIAEVQSDIFGDLGLLNCDPVKITLKEYVTLHGKTYLNAFANGVKNRSFTVRYPFECFQKPFKRFDSPF